MCFERWRRVGGDWGFDFFAEGTFGESIDLFSKHDASDVSSCSFGWKKLLFIHSELTNLWFWCQAAFHFKIQSFCSEKLRLFLTEWNGFRDENFEHFDKFEECKNDHNSRDGAKNEHVIAITEPN